MDNRLPIDRLCFESHTPRPSRPPAHGVSDYPKALTFCQYLRVRGFKIHQHPVPDPFVRLRIPVANVPGSADDRSTAVLPRDGYDPGAISVSPGDCHVA